MMTTFNDLDRFWLYYQGVLGSKKTLLLAQKAARKLAKQYDKGIEIWDVHLDAKEKCIEIIH